MSNTIDSLFGPLGKNYCIYFYILSVFGLIAAIILFFTLIFIGISKKKDFSFFINALTVVLVYVLFYFQNRLLFNMCSNTL